jgi:hypothetical protein
MNRLSLLHAVLAAALLGGAGCAIAPPASEADTAELATCTAQADATYDAQNYDQLSRTGQNGLLFSATPDHVFDAQRLGSLHERDDQLADCLRSGTGGTASADAAIPGPAPVAPQIIGQ